MYKYDVAVSYDSHNRDFVREVVEYLKRGSDGCQVFFDVENQQDMCSEHLKGKLYQIYQQESLLKVLFVSDLYLENQYTLLEARRSFDSTKDDIRRLVIINLATKQLPRPYCDYVYLKGDLPADDIATMIIQRLNEFKKTKNQEIVNGQVQRPKKQSSAMTIVNSGIMIGDNSNVWGNICKY